MTKLKGTPSQLPGNSCPREFATVLTLIFMASQTLDIVSRMSDDFDDTL